MVVWTVTIPMFCAVTAHNALAGGFGRGVRDSAIVRVLAKENIAIAVVWYAHHRLLRRRPVLELLLDASLSPGPPLGPRPFWVPVPAEAVVPPPGPVSPSMVGCGPQKQRAPQVG